MKKQQVVAVAITGLIMGGLATGLFYSLGSSDAAWIGFGLSTLIINIPILLYALYAMKEQRVEAK